MGITTQEQYQDNHGKKMKCLRIKTVGRLFPLSIAHLYPTSSPGPPPQFSGTKVISLGNRGFWISSDGDDRRIIFGFEIFDSGNFGGWENLASFLGGGLI